MAMVVFFFFQLSVAPWI